jgi:hypothetical protein
MPYIVIHQNPINNQYIRNEHCGDIVVFHISREVEVDEYEIDQLQYPEFDTKHVIKNKDFCEYIKSIQFPYDPVDPSNCLCDTRWCEATMICYFDFFAEMYDHVIVCRKYTVFHHMNSNNTIQYFYEEKNDTSNSPSSASI